MPSRKSITGQPTIPNLEPAAWGGILTLPDGAENSEYTFSSTYLVNTNTLFFLWPANDSARTMVGGNNAYGISVLSDNTGKVTIPHLAGINATRAHFYFLAIQGPGTTINFQSP